MILKRSLSGGTHRKRRVAKRIAVALLSGVGALFLAEGAIRIIAQQAITVDMYIPDDQVEKRIRPNLDVHVSLPGVYEYTVHTDSAGFRIPATKREEKAEPLVIVLGDSFAFGVGVEEEESFVGRLRLSLDGQARVINAGVPGTGLTAQLALYEFSLRSLEPDLLVLSAYANDVADCIRMQFYRSDPNGGAEYVETTLPFDVQRPPALVRWFLSWSHLYTLAHHRLGSVEHEKKRPAEAWETPPATGVEGEVLFLSCFSRLLELCEEHQTAVVVVALPDRKGLEHGRNSIAELLSTVEDPLRFTLIDPSPNLARADDESSIWFSEGHFDRRGHAAVHAALRGIEDQT